MRIAGAPANAVDLRLYGILDPQLAPGGDVVALAVALAAGGCTLLQLRDKSARTREVVERARAVKLALAGTGVPFLVNDRVDIALAAGADGVHLGQDDLHPSDARRLLGPDAIIGVTVKTASDADALYRYPVDYACIGGVFATASKANADPPIGLDGLNRIAFRVRLAAPGIPVGAIAGIDHGNAAHVIAVGADGVAVISALARAPDPADAARRLRLIVDQAVAARGRAP